MKVINIIFTSISSRFIEIPEVGQEKMDVIRTIECKTPSGEENLSVIGFAEKITTKPVALEIELEARVYLDIPDGASASEIKEFAKRIYLVKSSIQIAALTESMGLFPLLLPPIDNEKTTPIETEK